MPAISAQSIRNELKDSADEDVELVLGSCPGGDLWAGFDIYAELKNHKGHVTIELTSLCASAATVLICAADTVKAWPGTQLMFHLPSTAAAGNIHDMDSASEMLETAADNMLQIYGAKTGKDAAEIEDMLDKTSWMTPETASEWGFVDELIEARPEAEALPIAASLSGIDPAKIRAAKPVGEKLAAKITITDESIITKWGERLAASEKPETEWLKAAENRLEIEKQRYGAVAGRS